MNNIYRFLDEVDGIHKIGFDSEDDVLVVEYEGSPSRVEEFKAAIERAVVGKRLRKALGSLGRAAKKPSS